MRKVIVAIALVFFVVGCSHIKKAVMASSGNPVQASPEILVLGKQVYENNCMRCHGQLGQGDGPEAAELGVALPNFKDGSYQKASGLIGANVKYGKGEKMPAFQGLLSDQQIWSVVRYLESLRG